ncbi:kinase-like domain-containing protein [Roridomyces roridus]|uniref:Kinase-like domain-containing protein n=1 Tax=Roridomyces roridus TaxID=1738132 RepID=A0AAD7FNF4_9AGAR|nr:kinase-like domain-containing protein [Roridomyces roridus]
MPSSSASDLLPDLTRHFVDDGSVQLLSLIGSGGYGKVYKAWDGDIKEHVAVKVMPTYEPGSRSARAQANELELHQMLNGQPGVVTLIRYFTEDDLLFVVLELAADDLAAAISERRVFHNNTPLIKNTLGELIDAVERMHECGVYHRDIKPQNILCDAEGSHIRLADFGLATRDELSQQLGCGTRIYMSPGLFLSLPLSCSLLIHHTESLNPTKDSYSPRQSDLWALAILFTIMICERTPWQSAEPTDTGFAAFCDDPCYLLDALPITRPTFHLLERCFHPDPLERPSLEQFRDAISGIEVFTETPRASAPPLSTGEWAVASAPNSEAEAALRLAAVPMIPRRRNAPRIQFSSSSSSSSTSNSDASIPATCSTPPTSPASLPEEGLSCSIAEHKPLALTTRVAVTVAQKGRPILPTCRQFRLAAKKQN